MLSMNRLFGRYYKKVISGLMAFIFAIGSVGTSYAQNIVTMPAPGTMVSLSETFAPPLLKGIKVYHNDPFRFDFILDTGDATESDQQLKTDSNRLIKYFLASLTVPEKDLWVNLSPYEKNRIVPEAFGQTEMGRDLLAQDYILKQITASVIYPEGEVGKEFWAKVYAEAQKRYSSTDIPVDTFNKVWIVPEKATVYENKDAAFVAESQLKVMLEEDYLALEKNTEAKDQTAPATHKLGSDIVREVVIPILKKEVNEGKNFAPLRQVYNSLILATWYKRKLRASILGQAYVDRQKTAGIDIADKNEKEKIWQQYVEAFKKGAYNFIKEEYDPATQQTMPRKYFSGGTALTFGAEFQVKPVDPIALQSFSSKREKVLQTRADPAMMTLPPDIRQKLERPILLLLTDMDGTAVPSGESIEQGSVLELRRFSTLPLAPNNPQAPFVGVISGSDAQDIIQKVENGVGQDVRRQMYKVASNGAEIYEPYANVPSHRLPLSDFGNSEVMRTIVQEALDELGFRDLTIILGETKIRVPFSPTDNRKKVLAEIIRKKFLNVSDSLKVQPNVTFSSIAVDISFTSKKEGAVTVVEKVSARLKISVAEVYSKTMAVGDNENDVLMLNHVSANGGIAVWVGDESPADLIPEVIRLPAELRNVKGFNAILSANSDWRQRFFANQEAQQPGNEPTAAAYSGKPLELVKYIESIKDPDKAVRVASGQGQDVICDILKVNKAARPAFISRFISPRMPAASPDKIERLFDKGFIPGTFYVGERLFNADFLRPEDRIGTFRQWIHAQVKSELGRIKRASPSHIQNAVNCEATYGLPLEDLVYLTLFLKDEKGVMLMNKIPNQIFQDIFLRIISYYLFGDPYGYPDTELAFNARMASVVKYVIPQVKGYSLKQLFNLSVAAGALGIDLKSSASAASAINVNNVIPYFNGEETEQQRLERMWLDLEKKSERSLAIDFWPEFEEQVVKAKRPITITFFHDDYGETMLDLLFIEKLLKTNSNITLISVPRSGRYGNDATPEDITENLSTGLATLLQQGRYRISSKGPSQGAASGLEFSDEVVDLVSASEAIIGKGARSYEMLQGIKKDGYFSYMVCREYSETVTGVDSDTGLSVFIKQEAGLPTFSGFKQRNKRQMPLVGAGRVGWVASMTAKEYEQAVKDEKYKAIVQQFDGDKLAANQWLLDEAGNRGLTVSQVILGSNVGTPEEIGNSINAVIDELNVSRLTGNISREEILRKRLQILTARASEITAETYNQLAGRYTDLRKSLPEGKDLEYLQSFVQATRELNGSGAVHVLDVGTGLRDMRWFAQQNNVSVVGIDVSSSVVDLIKRQVEGVEAFVMNMDSLSFPENSFDGVRAWASLHHLPIIDESTGVDVALREFHRVLKPGGVCSILVKAETDGRKGFMAVDTKEGLGSRFYQFFSREDLLRLLQRNNFEVNEGNIQEQIDERGERNWVVLAKKPAADKAMGLEKGGIDLTPNRMDLQTTGSGEITFDLDSAMLQQVQNAPGMTPVVINILPLDSLQQFLGVKVVSAQLVDGG